MYNLRKTDTNGGFIRKMETKEITEAKNAVNHMKEIWQAVLESRIDADFFDLELPCRILGRRVPELIAEIEHLKEENTLLEQITKDKPKEKSKKLNLDTPKIIKISRCIRCGKVLFIYTKTSKKTIISAKWADISPEIFNQLEKILKFTGSCMNCGTKFWYSLEENKE